MTQAHLSKIRRNANISTKADMLVEDAGPPHYSHLFVDALTVPAASVLQERHLFGARL